MASHGFFRRDAPELSLQISGPLGQKCGPHLLETIRKTVFKISP
jgi:hypothetical protein